MRYACLKSWAEVGRAHTHNSRLKTVPNVNAGRDPPKELLLGTTGDLVRDVKERFEELGVVIPKLTGERVLALEIVLTFSKEWLHAATGKMKRDWIDQTLAWVKKRFREGVVSAMLHRDEETPHLHVIAIPVVIKPVKKAGRPPKDPAALSAWQTRQATSNVRWVLSRRDAMPGGRQNAQAMQDEYHAAVQNLGLHRGIQRNPEETLEHQPASRQRATQLEEIERDRARNREEQHALDEARAVLDKTIGEIKAREDALREQEQAFTAWQLQARADRAALEAEKREVEAARKKAAEIAAALRCDQDVIIRDRLEIVQVKDSIECSLKEFTERKVKLDAWESAIEEMHDTVGSAGAHFEAYELGIRSWTSGDITGVIDRPGERLLQFPDDETADRLWPKIKAAAHRICDFVADTALAKPASPQVRPRSCHG